MRKIKDHGRVGGPTVVFGNAGDGWHEGEIVKREVVERLHKASYTE